MIVNDTHCHFLSRRFFEALGREKYGPGIEPTAERIAQEIGCEPPGEPDELADSWVAELDRNGVARAALIASAAGDEESVAAAVARHPDRFAGFFMLNPGAADAGERVERAFTDLGLHCACLFPAMHRYRLDDPSVERIFESARTHGKAVFVHCGYLSVQFRAKLKLPSRFDLRYGDPLTLATVAMQFPTVPAIVPHFGAGFLREALMAADLCPSIHLDTSSSNAWVKYIPGTSLTDVFSRALEVAGADRLLFGTDSGLFPRGWRSTIYEDQRTILDALDIDEPTVAKIFGGNFDRIFGPARQTGSGPSGGSVRT